MIGLNNANSPIILASVLALLTRQVSEFTPLSISQALPMSLCADNRASKVVMIGLYRDNGKEHGNRHHIGPLRKESLDCGGGYNSSTAEILEGRCLARTLLHL